MEQPFGQNAMVITLVGRPVKNFIGRPTKLGDDNVTQRPTRERILDAAERLFASHGGEDGVSMRDLATAAEVKLSLLSYHFGSKSALYRAIFDRRANELAESRHDRLTEATTLPGFTLADLCDAFIRPSVAMRFAGDRQGSAFATLTALEAIDPREAERDILNRYYDPTARLFIDALARLYPGASRQSLVDAYLFMVGALVMTLSSESRFARLRGHEGEEPALADTDGITRRLIEFCTSGAHAVLTMPGDPVATVR